VNIGAGFSDASSVPMPEPMAVTRSGEAWAALKEWNRSCTPVVRVLTMELGEAVLVAE